MLRFVIYPILWVSLMIGTSPPWPICSVWAQSAGRLSPCYQPGDTIAPEVSVVDKSGNPQRLLDLAGQDTRLIYLVLFGGPSLNPSHTEGGLWCEDSFNDMPISNYLAKKYRDRGVRFIPVVCPPVYHERRFGYDPGAFLEASDTSEVFRDNFQRLVAATKALQKSRVIPFEAVYFDPRFRLLFNFEQMENLQNYAGGRPAWLGKFKPCGDYQRYSTPTIWLLSPRGEVLHEPFFGNRYADNRQQIRFTVRDVEAAIQSLLNNRDQRN